MYLFIEFILYYQVSQFRYIALHTKFYGLYFLEIINRNDLINKQLIFYMSNNYKKCTYVCNGPFLL